MSEAFGDREREGVERWIEAAETADGDLWDEDLWERIVIPLLPMGNRALPKPMWGVTSMFVYILLSGAKEMEKRSYICVQMLFALCCHVIDEQNTSDKWTFPLPFTPHLHVFLVNTILVDFGPQKGRASLPSQKGRASLCGTLPLPRCENSSGR
jgi:hypothetical protein